MLKAIVTGSEGFIGQALTQALKKRGVEVIGIDRKTGQEVKDIVKYMPDDIDVVFHLAAQTSVFNTDLTQIRKDNIDAFMEVVKTCALRYNRPKLVYASSSTANPNNTTSLYGISKHFAEEYAKTYLPSATGARLHNNYLKKLERIYQRRMEKTLNLHYEILRDSGQRTGQGPTARNGLKRTVTPRTSA